MTKSALPPELVTESEKQPQTQKLDISHTIKTEQTTPLDQVKPILQAILLMWQWDPMSDLSPPHQLSCS